MRRLLAVGVCASLCLAGPLWARAMMIAPPAGPVKLAQADAVVLGRVVGLEDRDVAAAPLPGALNKVNYRVAVVKVSEIIKGAKGADTLRVAFIAPQPVVPPRPGPGGIRPFIRRGPVLNLAPGQEGLFYLTKHATESFYVLPAYYSFTNGQAANYGPELTLARKTVKLLADPMAGLKSADAQDRLLTAGLLIGQYRNRKPGPVKTEPIGAEESKLILSALLDTDWNRPFRLGEMSPQMTFNQLGLTPADGWTYPRTVRTPQDINNAMRDWLRQHRDTYRIHRFVAPDQGVSR